MEDYQRVYVFGIMLAVLFVICIFVLCLLILISAAMFHLYASLLGGHTITYIRLVLHKIFVTLNI